MAAQAQGPSLTDDVVAEIIARLPAICIARARTVCRAWNAIASHPSVESVLAERPAAVTAIIKDRRCLYADEVERRGLRIVRVARFDRFRGRWHPAVHRTPPSPRAIYLDDMTVSTEAFHSWDGVLCTQAFPREPDAHAGYYMLWNPLTNACAVVSAPAPAAGQGRIIGGYAHPVTGRFHLLHSSDVAVSDDTDLVAPITVRILGVGDDSSSSWREVPLPVPPMVAAGCSSKSKTMIPMRGERDHSVSLHGKLHWLVQLTGTGKAAALLVFDTAREEFRFVAAPESPGLDPTTARLRVVPAGGKKLCVLAVTKQLEVWVLDDYSDPRSWRLRETIGTHLSLERFAAAAAVEVVEGINEGEEIFIHLEEEDDEIHAYSVRSKVWRRVSVARRCATLLMYRESAMHPQISFGKALRGFHLGTASLSSCHGWFGHCSSYTSADFPLK